MDVYYEPNCISSTCDSFANLKYSRSLSILCVNMRSIVGKFGDFLSFISCLKHSITFIVEVETWLDQQKDLASDIDGYKSHTLYRNRFG